MSGSGDQRGDPGDGDLRPAGFFLLRTPLLPFAEGPAAERSRALPDAPDDDDPLEEALAEDRASGRARLRALLENPEIMEALRLAGWDAEAGVRRWREDPDSRSGRKLERTLVLYWLRMSGRSAPFGLFAGTTVGEVGPKTQLLLRERAAARRHSFLHASALRAVAQAALSAPEALESARLRTAPTLQRVAGTVRWAGADHESGERFATERPALAVCLDAARDGASRAELVAALERAGRASGDRARAHVQTLVERGLIVPEAMPGPIGDALDELERADGISGGPAGVDVGALREALADLDADGLVPPEGAHERVERCVGRFADSLEVDGTLVQADLIRSADEVCLGEEVIEEIRRGMDALALWAARHPDPLRRLKDALSARYGEEWVPLLEALDPELGVGPEAVEPEPEPPASRPQEELLLGRVLEAAAAGSREIVLSPDDEEKLPPASAAEVDPLPAALATVIAESQEALDAGRFQVHLHATTGPPVGRLAGRAAASDPALADYLVRLAEHERALAPDAIHAELAGLPGQRMGAILRRPALYDWCIDLDGTAPSGPRSIPVSDILVAARFGRLVFRSRRQGRPVVPHLTSAISLDLPVRPALVVLGAVRYDRGSSSAWTWGQLDAAPFLPRVRTGRVILALARWRLRGEEIAELLAARRGPELVRAVRHLRAVRGLPRQVALERLDDMLPLDLEDVHCLEVLGRLLREDPERADFVELVPGTEQLLAVGPDGRYLHELIVPFIGSRAQASDRDRKIDPGGDESAHRSPIHGRRFAPGSEWLYLKAYCGRTVADRLLVEVIGPACRSLVEAGDADRWFFIRFRDDEHHLRVRLHGDAAALDSRVRPALEEALGASVGNGRVWRLALDTYDREVERYGGVSAIAIAESIFHADSEAVLESLRLQRESGADAEARWRLALAGGALLLEDAGLDAPGRLDALGRIRDGLASEIHGKRSRLSGYAAPFRERRTELEGLLAAAREGDGGGLAGIGPLISARPALRLSCEELREQATTPLDNLALSLVHMRINRLLPLQRRNEPELRIYDALARLEASALARQARQERS